MTAFLFPGQGSQIIGMGKLLFEEFPELTAKADSVLGYSIQTLCLDDPHQQLNQTDFTQPALYTVNALMYFKKINDTSVKPDYTAGHSLGEYNALLAAGVFDFETGLKLVKKRGELMNQASGGAMAAVIGLTADRINTLLQDNGLDQVVIANHNSRTQLVISGQKAAIDHARILCEQAGARMVIPLKVSGAFHSPCLRDAQSQFESYLNTFDFSLPRIPVIANCTARPYSTSGIADLLAQQMTHPVLWAQTIDYLLSQGELDFEETGPGAVLTGLVRRIKNGQ